MREKYAHHGSTALCSTNNVLEIPWHPEAYADPFVLPQGHFWDPTAEQVIDLLVFCIFDVQNPDNGLEHVTGTSDRAEFDLRKCIALDAIEYRGTYGQLNEAWTNALLLPDVIDVDEEPTATPRGSVGAAGVSMGPALKKKRTFGLRPTDRNKQRIDTNSGVALTIKKSAALMLCAILDHIAETHAASDGLVTYDIDVVISTNNLTAPNDWPWLLFYVLAVWLFIVHAIALYFLFGRACRRVRACIAVPCASVSIQVTLLPDVADLTVAGLRRELRNRGLRANGLRSDLESRLAAALAEST
jgi:hypothetical protein